MAIHRVRWRKIAEASPVCHLGTNSIDDDDMLDILVSSLERAGDVNALANEVPSIVFAILLQKTIFY